MRSSNTLQAGSTIDAEPQAPTLFDNLILLIYLVLLFEGALRKWVFPGAFDLLFFIRDPVVLAVYVYVLPRFGLNLHSKTLLLGLALAVAGTIAGLANISDDRIELKVLAYGLRNYFFYLPLIYLMGQRLTYAGWCRLVAVTIWLQGPLAILAVYEFSMPASHAINAGLVEGGLMQPGVFDDVIRVYGTFSSSPGQTTFITFSTAVLLWCLTLPKRRRPVSTRILAVGVIGALSMLAVSGSRGAFISTAFVGSIIAAATMISGRTRWRSSLAVAALTVTVAILMLTIFSRASDALYMRSIGADLDESEAYQFGLLGRIASDFTNFRDYAPVVPPLGFGAGTFGNANSGNAQTAGLLPLGFAPEDDWSRNICDLGPLLGAGYILWRCLLVAGLWHTGVRLLRNQSQLAPLILASFCTLTVLAGQLTGHGSVQGFGFLGAGFALASPSWFRRQSSDAFAQPLAAPHQDGPILADGRRAPNRPGYGSGDQLFSTTDGPR